MEFVKQKVHRVQRKHEREKRARVVHQMLERMHRQPAEWTGVVALVVEGMRVAVQESAGIQRVFPVPPRAHHSVRKVKMEVPPVAHDHEVEDGVQRSRPKAGGEEGGVDGAGGP